MNTNSILDVAKTVFYKTGFIFKKHAPEICLGLGTAGVVAGTIVACKKTLEMPDILGETKEEVNCIHATFDDPQNTPNRTDAPYYSPESKRKDLTKTYIRCGLKVAKNYAVPFALEAGGLGLIFGGHKILKDRNTNLALVAAASDKALHELQKRVEEKYGKEAANDICFGAKEEQISVEETTKKGEKKEVKKTIKSYNDPLGLYTKLFCEGCRHWCSDPDLAISGLRTALDWANRRLDERGYLFWNEVLEYLEIPETPLGATMGWVKDPKDPFACYVDFGLGDLEREDIQNFKNGWCDAMWLVFNVEHEPVLERAYKYGYLKRDQVRRN